MYIFVQLAAPWTGAARLSPLGFSKKSGQGGSLCSAHRTRAPAQSENTDDPRPHAQRRVQWRAARTGQRRNRFLGVAHTHANSPRRPLRAQPRRRRGWTDFDAPECATERASELLQTNRAANGREPKSSCGTRHSPACSDRPNHHPQLPGPISTVAILQQQCGTRAISLAIASPSQPEPARASQSQPEPARASQSQPEPARASQSQPGPARASQSQPGQPRATKGNQSQPEPARASQSQPDPARTSQIQPDPVRSSQT